MKFCSQLSQTLSAEIVNNQNLCFGNRARHKSGQAAGISLGDTGGPILDMTGSCFIGISSVGAFSQEGNEALLVVTRADYFADWMRYVTDT